MLLPHTLPRLGDDSATHDAESRLRLDLMMRVPVERRGFHARSAREAPMILPHALPNHGASYGWACARRGSTQNGKQGRRGML